MSTARLKHPQEVGFTPFRPGRFDQLPELPREPHPYFEAPAEDLEVDSQVFGKVRVHLRRWGQGPPLLLIHGLMTSGYSWRYAMPRLGQRFELLVPDLPGSGRSGMPRGPYDAPSYGVFLRELQDALGVGGCAAVGNSLGGYLALHALAQEPAAFSRLLVLHSPGVPELRLRALRAALLLPGARAALAAVVRLAPERWAFANVHYYDESLKSREEAREYGRPLSRPEGAAAFACILGEALAPADMDRLHRALLARAAAGHRVGERVRLVYVPEDPMVPPRVGAQLLRRLPGATFGWIEGGSHFAHVDAPDAFAREALSFFDATDSG